MFTPLLPHDTYPLMGMQSISSWAVTRHAERVASRGALTVSEADERTGAFDERVLKKPIKHENVHSGVDRNFYLLGVSLARLV